MGGRKACTVDPRVKLQTVARMRAGESPRALACEVGVSRTTLRRWAAGKGLGAKPHRPGKLSAVQKLVAAELYDECKASVAELAAVFGITTQAMYYNLGPVTRPRRWVDPERITALVRREVPDKTIIASLEIGKSTLYYWKKKIRNTEHVKA